MRWGTVMKEVYTMSMYLTTRNSNVIDDFFKSPFWNSTDDSFSSAAKMMRCDVKENDLGYVLSMELPGCRKEDINIELNEGYLTISASRSSSKEETTEGKYIRKERFEGSCKRSFYVGDYPSESNVSASYTDGILTLEIPKQPEPMPEEPKKIAIN